MKLVTTLLTCLFLLSPNLAMSETMEDMVKRHSLYYKKFTNVPFTGKITGRVQSYLKNGKWDGPYVEYWKNGQLKKNTTYVNGKRHGPYVIYWGNGEIYWKTTLVNGKRHGPYIEYNKDGTIKEKGRYENDKYIPD
jgi:hypothetical protein